MKLAIELLDTLVDELLRELAGFELEREVLDRLELLLAKLLDCTELLTLRLLLLRLVELLVVVLLLEATKELLVAALLLAASEDGLVKELAD